MSKEKKLPKPKVFTAKEAKRLQELSDRKALTPEDVMKVMRGRRLCVGVLTITAKSGGRYKLWMHRECEALVKSGELQKDKVRGTWHYSDPEVVKDDPEILRYRRYYEALALCRKVWNGPGQIIAKGGKIRFLVRTAEVSDFLEYIRIGTRRS